MLRVTKVLATGSYDPTGVADSVILTRPQRQAGRGVFVTTNGAQIELDPATPEALRMGDALVLDDGRLIEVIAEAEPLLEVRVPDVARLARLAWHLGDRHIAVQILPRRLRVSRDSAVAELLHRLGAQAVAIEAPFEPEGGAYQIGGMAAHGHDDHDHAHDHHHGHDHHGHHHHHHDEH
jgi:urease accessory protein